MTRPCQLYRIDPPTPLALPLLLHFSPLCLLLLLSILPLSPARSTLHFVSFLFLSCCPFFNPLRLSAPSPSARAKHRSFVSASLPLSLPAFLLLALSFSFRVCPLSLSLYIPPSTLSLSFSSLSLSLLLEVSPPPRAFHGATMRLRAGRFLVGASLLPSLPQPLLTAPLTRKKPLQIPFFFFFFAPLPSPPRVSHPLAAFMQTKTIKITSSQCPRNARSNRRCRRRCIRLRLHRRYVLQLLVRVEMASELSHS